MKTHAFRLQRGQDLRKEIDSFVNKKNISAGIILTCVGNLKKVIFRTADGKTVKTMEGTFEIVSLVGTAESGNSHFHISFSDVDGNTFGGHLKNGTIIGTTAEIALGELEGVTFKREPDSNTGYDELVVN